MLPDAHPDLIRSQSLAFVNLDVLPQAVLYEREVREPALQFRCGVNTSQVLIAGPEAEPATHLHQRVITHAPAHKETHQQTLQSQSAREPVTTHRDGLE